MSWQWHWKWTPLDFKVLAKRPPAWIALAIAWANLVSASWAKDAVFVGLGLIIVWNMRVRK